MALSKTLKVVGVVTLAAIVGAFLLVAFVGDVQKVAAQDAKDAQVVLSVDPAKVSMDTCNTLVAKYGGKVVTVDGTKTPFFTVGALKPVGSSADQRLWSDAVNVPLKPQTLEAEQAAVCSDPAQAAMVMNGMASVKIGGKSVADLNKSWMKAQGNPGVINDWAQSCLGDDVSTHLACAKTMAYTAELLGRFHDDGVKPVGTMWNYHLAGPTVGSVPEFALNPKQYTGQFLVVSYTAKAQTMCVKVGFNVGVMTANGGDQRFAGFTCVAKKQPKPSPSTTRPPGTHPPTQPPTTRPPTTRPPTTPPTTRTTPPSGGKHYSDAPTPDAPVKTCPAGQYLDRYSNTCKTTSTSTSTSTSGSGQGDSGPGATNTTTPPATNSPAATIPTTTSPPTTVPPPVD